MLLPAPKHLTPTLGPPGLLELPEHALSGPVSEFQPALVVSFTCQLKRHLFTGALPQLHITPSSIIFFTSLLRT